MTILGNSSWLALISQNEGGEVRELWLEDN